MILNKIILQKIQQVGLLERICQALELTETQYKEAKDHYQAVGKWLSNSEDSVLNKVSISPQGSLSYGTTVRPIGQNEFDLDLVSLLAALKPSIDPALVKRLIGDRLKEHSYYKTILEEKTRCWRLNYANAFHLDITPSIPNRLCVMGGELVPDKLLRAWKPTNPKGYTDWFNKLAELQPRIQFIKGAIPQFESNIESLPDPVIFKGVLKRCVQLCKRHRDLNFLGKSKEIAPISIIITTLAAKAYTFCVNNFPYETELDVLLDVVRRLPDFIETHEKDGRQHYFIWNETTPIENFAEKWNGDKRLPDAFYSWQQKALSFLERVTKILGRDELYNELSLGFGGEIVKKAVGEHTTLVSNARTRGMLSASPNLGLTISSAKCTRIPSNTFYGT